MDMMGDGLPDAQTAAAAAIVNHRPQTLLSCVVNGKLNIRRLFEFQKRSYEEFSSVVADLLDTDSPLLQEGGADERDLDEEVLAQQTNKRRKEKHVIMFSNPITGERLRLLPRVSLW
jgi:hypothetical protein